MSDAIEIHSPNAPITLCTWKPATECDYCSIQGEFMCRYESKDLVHFLMLLLPFAVTVIAGTIRARYGMLLFWWLAYSIFFFFVWEARVLCRHCPMWAEDSRVLHCHANSGVIKIFKFKPGPMSKSEQMQFLLGGLIWFAFPFVFLLMGREYLLSFIGLAAVVSGIYSLRQSICSRCINFSCPLNTVRKEYVDAYLQRNPEIRAAWEKSGYRLGE